MPLVSSKIILEQAMAGGYAVGAFNAFSAETVQVIVEAAEEARAPVIVQISESAIKYAGLEMASAMVRARAEIASVPVVLHLDHGTSFPQNARCLRTGFMSLMFDGSALALEDNIAVTTKIVEMAHAVGVPVEAELGKIPRIDDYETMLPSHYDYTARLPSDIQEKVNLLMADPEQAAEFVEHTKCDSLAVAIGSVHGMKRAMQPLNIRRLDAIREKTGVPLVLHGASGVIYTHEHAREMGIVLEDGEGTLEDAILHGVTKINVATEISMALLRGIKSALAQDSGQKDLRKIMLPAKEQAKQVVRHYIRLFGAEGKAEVNGARNAMSSGY